MRALSFEWDESKNRANQLKHGVSFEETRSAFLAENARLIAGSEHSDDESRFVILGLSIRAGCWWCVTATADRLRQFVSSPLGERARPSAAHTLGG